MNRARRRAEAAKAHTAAARHEIVRHALACLASNTDPTVTGATLMLPSGETLYLDAAMARSMKPGRAARKRGGGTCH